MYRILLSRSGIAYAKECSEELDNSEEFVEALQDFIYGGDVIILVEDLEDLKDALSKEYIIKVV